MRDKGTPVELEHRRLLAVQRVLEGYSTEEVADFLGVDPRSVRRWIAAFRHEGSAGLLARPAAGRPCKLTNTQEKIIGFNPTKVRNVSQGSGQLLERPDLPRIDSLQIHEVPRARDLGGRIPTESRSFSSEKSYSPSRLMCCQETAEPAVTDASKASRVSASEASAIFCVR